MLFRKFYFFCFCKLCKSNLSKKVNFNFKEDSSLLRTLRVIFNSRGENERNYIFSNIISFFGLEMLCHFINKDQLNLVNLYYLKPSKVIIRY